LRGADINAAIFLALGAAQKRLLVCCHQIASTSLMSTSYSQRLSSTSVDRGVQGHACWATTPDDVARITRLAMSLPMW
jgi:hypothetical protein